MSLFFPRHISVKVGSSKILASLVNARKGIFILTEPFQYSIRYHGVTYEFNIPIGFKTNFASVPKWAWKLFHPLDERLLVASCVHDFVLNEQRQTDISRKVTVDGEEVEIHEVIDGFLAADLFFFSLSQEGSYNLPIRQLLRLCVKGWYFSTLKGWVKVD